MLETEDYVFSFSESEEFDSIDEKIRAVFSDSKSTEIKIYAANGLIGNIPARKLSENVGKEFNLCGFYVKNTVFKDEKRGKYTVIFGNDSSGLCAFATSSDKVYEALMIITSVFGNPSKWKNDIKVKIRMNILNDSLGKNNNKSYCLEVLD